MDGRYDNVDNKWIGDRKSCDMYMVWIGNFLEGIS